MGFETFVGNPRVVSVLRQMLRSGRLPHALLLTGPAGIGKLTLAVMLARAVNCAAGGDDFCGACPACQAIGQLEQPDALVAAALAERGEQPDAATVERVPLVVQAHPDVWLVPPDPVRRLSPVARPVLRMGQLRAVQRAAVLAPRLRRRIFILAGADTMRWDYATILLKTLEEPPETALFVLLAPAPETLLPTLRSRCFVFRLAPVPAAQVEKFLAERRPELKAGERRLVAHLARGRPVSRCGWTPGSGCRCGRRLCACSSWRPAARSMKPWRKSNTWSNRMPKGLKTSLSCSIVRLQTCCGIPADSHAGKCTTPICRPVWKTSAGRSTANG